MADSLRQAITFLKAAGPRSFLSASIRRAVSTAMWILPGNAIWKKPLEEAVPALCVGGARPGDVIWSMQQPEEILHFLEHARKLRPRTVVEIGTAAGGTLHFLSRVAMDSATIVSVDLPGGRFGGGYSNWRRLLYRRVVKSRQTLHLIRENSQDDRTLQAVKKALGGAMIDLLFIDGDHTYNGVSRDFEIYSKLVRVGGMIAMHDIVPSPGDPAIEVSRLWDEIRHSERECFEIRGRHEGGGFGIGVVRV